MDDIQITGEPMTVPTMCRFTVDRPLYPDQSYHFGSAEAAELSPLAGRLFEIEGVSAVLITDNRVTVTKRGPVPWPEVGRQVGAAIRAHIASGDPAWFGLLPTWPALKVHWLSSECHLAVRCSPTSSIPETLPA